MDDYKVTDRAYLARCREQLLLGTKQGLFYAAFELKCFVETKLAEYVEHWDGTKSGRVKPYKIGENARTIQKLKIGEIVIALRFVDEGAGVDETHYHTPVPERLKTFAEKYIDRMRHAQVAYRASDDPWWDDIRVKLLENYRLAWFASRGTIPVPPLFDWSKPGESLTHSMTIMYPDGMPENTKGSLHDNIVAGKKMALNIQYLDEPPEEWVCDL